MGKTYLFILILSSVIQRTQNHAREISLIKEYMVTSVNQEI